MTSIVKAIAAAVAASLGFGLPSAPASTHHRATPATAGISRVYIQTEPDLFSGRRGRLGAGVAQPLPAPADPEAAPASDLPASDVPAPDPAVVVSQPLAQLPIAAPPAAAPAPAPARPPAVVVGSTQQALINQDRAGAGLAPLTWNACLAAVAYQNAQRMAAQGYISHANGVNQDLGCGIGSHSGENVGYWSGGINDAQLNTMFMNSAGHRANIMGSYTYVGTAWVVAPDGKAYIAVEFD